MLRDGTPVTLRLAQVDDAAAVLAYMRSASAESDYLTFAPAELALTLEDEQRFIEGLGTDQLLLLALVDGEIVSAATVMRRMGRPRIAHLGILGVSVRRQFWGRGLGRLMMQRLIAWSREHGVRQLNLEVRTDNARASGLYERLGFTHFGRTPRAFLVDGVFYDTDLMGMSLD